MNKRILIEESEREEILSLHNKTKKILTEKLVKKYGNPRLLINEQPQYDWRDEALEKCPTLVNKKGKINKSEATNKKTGDKSLVLRFVVDKSYIDELLTSNPSYDIMTLPIKIGDVIVYYEDQSLKTYSKDGKFKKESKWECKTRQKDEEEKKGLESFLKTGDGGPWYTYNEAVTQKVIDWGNPSSYDKVWKFGQWLYHPKGMTGQLGVSTKQQEQYTKPYADKGWLMPNDPLLTGPQKDSYVEVVVPGSEKAFPPDGIKMYKPIEDIVSSVGGESGILAKAKKVASQGKIERKDCKELLSSYWEQYKTNIGSQRKSPDTDLKLATQRCIGSYYNNWKETKFGALVGGESTKFDEIVDTLTGEVRGNGYQGYAAPLQNSPWRLRPKNYQPTPSYGPDKVEY